MHEKIVEILVYLISELRKNPSIGDIDLTVLSQKGYSSSEISTAFNWLYEKISKGDATITDTAPSSPHSHRVLHEAERSVISSEAYGYLIQLRELGLITELDIEVIIDRIMMSGYLSVNIEEIKFMVVALLMENDDSLSYGSRKMLNGNDTVH
jgi:Smg protein